MTLTLDAKHLKRHVEIARLLIRYGRKDLVRDASWAQGLEGDVAPDKDSGDRPEKLARDLERMGPTFVKLGQILSTRADLLPIEYLDALSRLQDNVEPLPFPEVEEVVTRELGVRISKGFSEFDRSPLAAASLGQVHAATLRDGRRVAVKVQRPGIQEAVADDMHALGEIAEFLDAHTDVGRTYEFAPMLHQFRLGLLRELDYREEARNLSQLKNNLAEFHRIVVPSPVASYTTQRVLTMDYVHGRKVTKLSPLARLEMDRSGLAEELFHAYLKMVLVDGFFHADPHPGNVFMTDDGRIALIDLGMVARVAPTLQGKLVKLLLAVAEGRGEDAAEVAEEMGEKRPWFEPHAFRNAISEIVVRHHGASVAQVEVGRLVMEISRLSAQGGVRVPPELTMLGKTLLNLDRVGRALDPDFEPNDSIRRNSAEIMAQRMRSTFSAAGMLTTLSETREFLEKLPNRASRIAEVIANNELQLKVDAIDEDRLIEGIQKVANRITMGLVLAALIVGAALLMRVDTPWRLFGYPGLAMVCFLIAAGGGLGLVLTILKHDRETAANRKPKPPGAR